MQTAIALSLLLVAQICPYTPVPIELPTPRLELEQLRNELLIAVTSARKPSCQQEVLRSLGEVEVALGELAGAIGPLTMAVLGPSRIQSAQAALALGDAYARSGQSNKAIESYLFAHHEAPDTAVGQLAVDQATALGRLSVKSVHHPKQFLKKTKAPAVLLAGKRRSAIAIDSTGQLAILGKDTVTLMTPNQGTNDISVAKNTRALSYDASGTLWMAVDRQLTNSREGIQRINSGTKKLAKIDSFAIDGWGRFVLIRKGRAQLWTDLSTPGPALGRADQVVALSHGFALLEHRKKRVRLVPAEEWPDFRSPADLSKPVAIAADRFDNIYLLDREARSIQVLTPSGNTIATVAGVDAGVELRDGIALAVQPAGQVYVLTQRGSRLAVLE